MEKGCKVISKLAKIKNQIAKVLRVLRKFGLGKLLGFNKRR